MLGIGSAPCAPAPQTLTRRPQVIGNKYESYVKSLLDGQKPADAMNDLGLKRYCCRRMVLTHVNLIDKLLSYHSFTRKSDVALPAALSK